MGSVLNFPGTETNPAMFMPTVLTGEVVSRMAQANQVARMLRSLGYRILDEDVCPNDGGSPIIQIDLAGVRTRALENLSDAMTTHASGLVRVHIDGVRVFWQGSAQ